MQEDVLQALPGGPALLDWFGYVPRFHDAEVLDLSLDRNGPTCTLRIHAFAMRSETDDKGYFLLDKHVVVTLRFLDVSDVVLNDFNHQNVLFGLALQRLDNARYRLDLETSYGLYGSLEAASVEIELAPGKPPGGIYAA